MNRTERWQELLGRTGLADPDGTVLRELETLYRQRHRKYHDLQHVEDCLGHLDAFPVEGADADAIELAIWFHDAIYAPLKSGNEQASADLAAERLASMGARPELVAKVVRLILATLHDRSPADLDEALLIDIDLATLGADEATYRSYEANIRREYRLVPGPLYRRKRKAILQAFLDRESIYNTALFRGAFEAKARGNLAWAIDRL